MTTTITVCLAGPYEFARAAFDRHTLPTRSIVEIIGGPIRTISELPDSDEVRARLKNLAGEYRNSLLSVVVATVYQEARR